MMKMKEKAGGHKKGVETPDKKCAELCDDELDTVTGGAMIVNHNMASINELTQLNHNASALNKSLQKLSSGMTVNSSADDPSGYQISERMRVQIRALDQENCNAQSGSYDGGDKFLPGTIDYAKNNT